MTLIPKKEKRKQGVMDCQREMMRKGESKRSTTLQTERTTYLLSYNTLYASMVILISSRTRRRRSPRSGDLIQTWRISSSEQRRETGGGQGGRRQTEKKEQKEEKVEGKVKSGLRR